MQVLPTLAALTRRIVLLPALLFAAATGAATPNCFMQNGHEIGKGVNTVIMGSHSAFDPYHYLLIDPVDISSVQEHTLSDYQQARLRTSFRSAIELDWQERLGWRSSRQPGDRVLRLNIHINDIMMDQGNTDTTMKFDVSLSDSLTGEQLMAQCNKTLKVSRQIVAVDSNDGVFWNHLQNRLRHWGAGLGSHIMTAY